MINIGDTVKVIGKTLDGTGEMSELIPIGTICKVSDISDDENGRFIEVVPVDKFKLLWGYWYKEDELEKGHLE